MDKNYGELIEYLDERFTKVDEKIEKLDNKFELKFNQLIESIDKLAKSLEIYHDEQKAISFKIDQHEKWIQEMAEKIGMKLNQ